MSKFTEFTQASGFTKVTDRDTGEYVRLELRTRRYTKSELIGAMVGNAATAGLCFWKARKQFRNNSRFSGVMFAVMGASSIFAVGVNGELLRTYDKT